MFVWGNSWGEGDSDMNLSYFCYFFVTPDFFGEEGARVKYLWRFTYPFAMPFINTSGVGFLDISKNHLKLLKEKKLMFFTTTLYKLVILLLV